MRPYWRYGNPYETKLFISAELFQCTSDLLMNVVQEHGNLFPHGLFLSIYYRGQVPVLNTEEFWSVITQLWQLPAFKKRANEGCCLPAPSLELNKAPGEPQSCPVPLLQIGRQTVFPPAPSSSVHKAHLLSLGAL